MTAAARPFRVDHAPFVLVHTDLGLTDHDSAWTFLRGADGKERLLAGVEQVLFNIDLIQEPDRAKLLASAAEHYDMPYSAMMGRPEQTPIGTVAVSGGAQ